MSDSHISQVSGRLRVQATPPSSPATGDMFWDTDQKAVFIYNGSSWLGFKFTASTAVSPGGSIPPASGTHLSSWAANIRAETSAPTSPHDGDYYYDTNNDQLVVYDLIDARWYTGSFSTTTSTSTSTTTTSTSSSTSTSTSTSTTISTTTTSTSTTTTL